VELAGAADRLALGDLRTRIPVRTRDEVGRLAVALNRMTRETDCYLQALTTSRDQLRGHLSVLGDTLASTHDLDRILRVILRSATVVTGARGGAVLLLDETGHLVDGCTEGPGRIDARVAAGLPVDPQVLHRVATTGEPARGRTAPAPATGEDAGPGEPAGGTYLAVPLAVPPTRDDPDAPPDPGDLRSPGRPAGAGVAPAPEDPPGPSDHPDPGGGSDGHRWGTPGHPGGAAEGSGYRQPEEEPGGLPGGALGVLVLHDRPGGDDFDDDDLATLRTFARHAAVAVRNVRAHEEVQRLSLTDPLTGLWNYRYLRESLRREVERASRFGRMLSVLALDLDRFKTVNDTYGHPAGDVVLAEFARRLRGEIREVDLAFRQGGEEFVVLLPETDARGAAILAERLGAVVRSSPVLVETNTGTAVPVPVTVSVGIAVYPDHATVGQQVLDAADGALYAAKAAGRDTWRVAVPPARPSREEIAVRIRAVPPADDLPRAGAPGGASSGPHPPRQPRGR
jgi:diguanylate cyclase (GGDEF)-like protein